MKKKIIFFLTALFLGISFAQRAAATPSIHADLIDHANFGLYGCNYFMGIAWTISSLPPGYYNTCIYSKYGPVYCAGGNEAAVLTETCYCQCNQQVFQSLIPQIQSNDLRFAHF